MGDVPIADAVRAVGHVRRARPLCRMFDLARDAQVAGRHGAAAVVEAVRAGQLAPQDAATEFAYAFASRR